MDRGPKCKAKTIQLLEQRRNLEDFGYVKDFLNMSKKHKQDFIKIKNFGTSKHTARKMKTKPHILRIKHLKRTSNYRKNSCNLIR